MITTDTLVQLNNRFVINQIDNLLGVYYQSKPDDKDAVPRLLAGIKVLDQLHDRLNDQLNSGEQGE